MMWITSAFDTFRTCRDLRVKYAFGGEAEVVFRACHGRLLGREADIRQSVHAGCQERHPDGPLTARESQPIRLR